MELNIRLMTPSDIPFAMRLKDEAGWNQLEKDWLRFLRLEPSGCFLAEQDNVPCGTVTTITYGPNVGWISMLLVLEQWRRQGIGTALFRRAFAHLRARGVETIKLDATDAGRPLYARHGFAEEFQVIRMRGPRLSGSCLNVTPLKSDKLDAVAIYDRHCFGADRRALLATYLDAEIHGCGIVPGEGDTLRGYCLARPGRRCWQVGPIAADSLELCLELLLFALADLPSESAYVDVLASQGALLSFLMERGFVAERTFTRMSWGKASQRIANYYISAGAEFG